MPDYNPFRPGYFSLNCGGKLLSLEHPVVMGILNATPDSFYDGGRYATVASAVNQAERMLQEGASVLDVGGSSSRPGSVAVDEQEESQRVLPVIEALMARFPEAILSVDTFRASVARRALDAGACIVNDISAGDDDPEMIPLVASRRVPFIAMHKQGTQRNMQHAPAYQNVVTEILDYFIRKTQQLRQAGIADMVIDPGFGFGKTTDHNYSLLKNLHVFAMLSCPILVGVSRKRMINEVLGTLPDEALNGTTALNTLALTQGANILRVHDVKEAVQAVKLFGRFAKADNA